MQPTETIDGEAIDEDETGHELVRHHDPPAEPVGGVLAVRDPAEMIAQAAEIANQLKDVVKKAGLITKIGGKDYLNVEAWTTLGVLVGCTARTEWTRPVDGGWEAAVEVVNRNGQVVGRAEAECLRAERNWGSRDDYALRSMAQTRAMGKALRMPLGWIAVLAGYSATPAEEMPTETPPAARRSASAVTEPDAKPEPSAEPAATEKPAQRMISEPQKKKINVLKSKVIDPHFEDPAWRDWLNTNFGVRSITELTSKSASALIERLSEAERKLG